jgi:hypothetical protein
MITRTKVWIVERAKELEMFMIMKTMTFKRAMEKARAERGERSEVRTSRERDSDALYFGKRLAVLLRIGRYLTNVECTCTK